MYKVKSMATNRKLLVKSNKLYSSAKSQYSEKKYIEAVKTLDKLIKLMPQHEKALALHMKAKYELEDHNAVIQDAIIGIALNGTLMGSFYRFKSFSNYVLGNESAEEDDAENAVKHHAFCGALYCSIARKKFKNKKYQAAITQATKSLNHSVNKKAEAYEIRAKAKFELGNFVGAISDDLALTKLDPNKYFDVTNNLSTYNKMKLAALSRIANAYKKLNKPADALQFEIEAFKLKKTIEPVSLASLCKFYIFENHGKVMTASPSNCESDFNALKAVLARYDITQESIHMFREKRGLPTGAPDLFVALNEEEERRARIHFYKIK
jgi:tetratricopeptide (TPR) repeat protein